MATVEQVLTHLKTVTLEDLHPTARYGDELFDINQGAEIPETTTNGYQLLTADGTLFIVTVTRVGHYIQHLVLDEDSSPNEPQESPGTRDLEISTGSDDNQPAGESAAGSADSVGSEPG